MMCAKQDFQWGEIISALHCEFMRQALGSSAVQSAASITSDVSHCLGLACSEESMGKAGSTRRVGRRQGWGDLGLFIREERCSECPVVHCCEKPKPTQ